MLHSNSALFSRAATTADETFHVTWYTLSPTAHHVHTCRAINSSDEFHEDSARLSTCNNRKPFFFSWYTLRGWLMVERQHEGVTMKFMTIQTTSRGKKATRLILGSSEVELLKCLQCNWTFNGTHFGNNLTAVMSVKVSCVKWVRITTNSSPECIKNLKLAFRRTTSKHLKALKTQPPQALQEKRINISWRAWCSFSETSPSQFAFYARMGARNFFNIKHIGGLARMLLLLWMEKFLLLPFSVKRCHSKATKAKQPFSWLPVAGSRANTQRKNCRKTFASSPCEWKRKSCRNLSFRRCRAIFNIAPPIKSISVR